MAAMAAATWGCGGTGCILTLFSTPSPRQSGERVGDFSLKTQGLLTPALSSLGGGEGENKNSVKLRRWERGKTFQLANVRATGEIMRP